MGTGQLMAEVNVGTCEGTPRLLLTRTVQDRAVFFFVASSS